MSCQYPFTPEEIRAIASLKKAFNKCNSLGLKFSGMDDSLLVANSRVLEVAVRERSDKDSDYNEVAFAVLKGYSGADTLLTSGPYVDSGGW